MRLSSKIHLGSSLPVLSLFGWSRFYIYIYIYIYNYILIGRVGASPPNCSAGADFYIFVDFYICHLAM